MNTQSTTQLILLPFAGGTSYAYQGLIRAMPTSLACLTLDYPGHGSRIREPLLTGLPDLLEDTVRQVSEHAQARYALYGHSMGAVLAFLTSARLKERGLTTPTHIFVSGRGGLLHPPQRNRYHELDPVTFWEEVRQMGGVPEELLADSEVRSFFEPILRADFKVVETMDLSRPAALDIPISVMMGAEDNRSIGFADPWDGYSTAGCQTKTFQGGHFFLFNHLDAVAEHISATLGPSLPG